MKYCIPQGCKCRASLDSLKDTNDYIPSLRSRGLLLHSAATAQSTMDYSTMAVDEGVVESPVPRVGISKRLESVSPMWPQSISQSPIPNQDSNASAKRALYGRAEKSDRDEVMKVCSIN